MSDNTWICQLSLEMCKQLPCYNGMPQEKVCRGRGAPGEGVLGMVLWLPSSRALILWDFLPERVSSGLRA